jgi:hypothetical protein
MIKKFFFVALALTLFASLAFAGGEKEDVTPMAATSDEPQYGGRMTTI